MWQDVREALVQHTGGVQGSSLVLVCHLANPLNLPFNESPDFTWIPAQASGVSRTRDASGKSSANHLRVFAGAGGLGMSGSGGATPAQALQRVEKVQ